MAMVLDRPPVANRKATGRPMPIKTTRLEFDDDGYPEWYAVVRTNVRGAVMDDYRSGDQDRWWAAIGQIVQEWNFCDEDGQPIAPPRQGTQSKELPEDLLSALLRKFREAFEELARPPKEPSESSTSISTTTP